MKNRKSNHKIIFMYTVMVLGSIAVVFNILFTMTTHLHIWSGVDVLTPLISSSMVESVVEARRGTIYDRSMNVIAQEVNAYTLVAYLSDQHKNADGTDDYVQDIRQTAKTLASYLEDVDENDLREILENAQERGAAQTELGKGTKRLSKELMEKITEADIPGIGFINTTNREYPASPFSSNLVGFASYDEETQTIKGSLGLEETLNDYLAGQNGLVRYQQTVSGTILPDTTTVSQEAIAGDSVVLTIDSNLQQVVEQQLAETMRQNNAQYCWAIVMEPETGKILAWGSYPSFNQNDPDEIPSFIDHVAQTNMEVGSVMKPITYAVAMDTGVYPEEGTTFRSGTFNYTESTSGKIVRVDNSIATEFQPIQEALGEDFGTITFDEGLWHSSNVGICELLANYINKDDYEAYLKNFGLFQPTDIDYVQESLGVKNLATATDYLSTGFGQASSITVLQLMQAYTAIFNDGKMMKPYIVESILSPDGASVVQEFQPEQAGKPISSETANRVTQLMRGVVSEGASGDRFAMDGVDLALKTGTGQLYNENTGSYDTTIHTSSVIAAAPADDPKVMVYWGMVSGNYLNYSATPFQEIMSAALIANGINGSGKTTTTNQSQEWHIYDMPELVNHSSTYADSKLAGMNVNVVRLGEGSTIINQFPEAGSQVHSNAAVFLLTDGSSLTMPDMTGWTRKDITAFWQLTGISIQTSGYGTVTAQSLDPGVAISQDTPISVVLE